MKRSVLIVLFPMLILTTLGNLGCQTWGGGKSSTTWWGKSKEPLPPDAPENFGTAVKMDISWKDDILPGPNGKLQRGLGGRVHFLDKKEKPIRVHGSLTVYGFDEQDGKVDSTRPDRRFHIKDDELQNLYSHSMIGHSYNIWLPWDENSYRRHVAVLAIFRAEDGQLLRSDYSQTILHGPEGPDPISALTNQKQRRVEENRLVERVVYQTPALQQTEEAEPLSPEFPTHRVKTISVPSQAGAVHESVRHPMSTDSKDRERTSRNEAATGPNINNVTDLRYGATPYQPSQLAPNVSASNPAAGRSQNQNWDRAYDQFMRTGPRKNTGVPGAFPTNH